MTIIVTGAAGFIGSNIVKALNQRGITDIVAVDNLTRGEKFKNLAECEIAHYLDKCAAIFCPTKTSKPSSTKARVPTP